MKQKSILFVCTGNVFRSMSAEYCFKKHLSNQGIKNWKVNSAGIVAKRGAPIDPKTIKTLESIGIKEINHNQKRLTKHMLNSYNIIIAMSKNHLNFIKSKLGYKNALLFNELASNKKSSIMDIEDEIKDYKTNRKAVEKKIEETVKEIYKKTPALFKNVSKLPDFALENIH